MATQLQRRHYELMAAALQRVYLNGRIPAINTLMVVNALADELAKDNPLFNSSKFVAACVERTNGTECQMSSAAQRLVAMGYDLEELERDNPYNQGVEA